MHINAYREIHATWWPIQNHMSSAVNGQSPGGQNPGGQTPGEICKLGQNPRANFRGGGQNPRPFFKS